MTGLSTQDGPENEWSHSCYAYARTMYPTYAPITSGCSFRLEYGLYSKAYAPIFAAPSLSEATKSPVEELKELLTAISSRGINTWAHSDTPQHACNLVTAYGILLPAIRPTDRGRSITTATTVKLIQELADANKLLPEAQQCSIGLAEVAITIHNTQLPPPPSKSVRIDDNASPSSPGDVNESASTSYDEDELFGLHGSHRKSVSIESLGVVAESMLYSDRLFINPENVACFSLHDWLDIHECLDVYTADGSNSSLSAQIDVCRPRGKRTSLVPGSPSLYGLNFEAANESLLKLISEATASVKDTTDDEVGNKRKRSGDESATATPATTRASEATPSASAHADTVGADDDDIVFVGFNSPSLPHSREHCPTYVFDTSKPVCASNERRCDKCYCYICEVSALECKAWASHCHARAQGPLSPIWIQLREHVLNLQTASTSSSTVAALQEPVSNVFFTKAGTGTDTLFTDLKQPESRVVMHMLTIWPANCEVAMVGLEVALKVLRKVPSEALCMRILIAWDNMLKHNVIIDRWDWHLTRIVGDLSREDFAYSLDAVLYFVNHIYDPGYKVEEYSEWDCFYLFPLLKRYQMSHELVGAFMDRIYARTTYPGQLLLDAAIGLNPDGEPEGMLLIAKADSELYLRVKDEFMWLIDAFLDCLPLHIELFNQLTKSFMTVIDHYELYSVLPKLADAIKTLQVGHHKVAWLLRRVPADCRIVDIYALPQATLTSTSSSSSALPETVTRATAWADFGWSLQHTITPAAFLAQLGDGMSLTEMLDSFKPQERLDGFIKHVYTSVAGEDADSYATLLSFTTLFETLSLPKLAGIVSILAQIPMLCPSIKQMYYKLIAKLCQQTMIDFAPTPSTLNAGYAPLYKSQPLPIYTIQYYARSLECLLRYMGFTMDVVLNNLIDGQCLIDLTEGSFDLQDVDTFCPLEAELTSSPAVTLDSAPGSATDAASGSATDAASGPATCAVAGDTVGEMSGMLDLPTSMVTNEVVCVASSLAAVTVPTVSASRGSVATQQLVLSRTSSGPKLSKDAKIRRNGQFNTMKSRFSTMNTTTFDQFYSLSSPEKHIATSSALPQHSHVPSYLTLHLLLSVIRYRRACRVHSAVSDATPNVYTIPASDAAKLRPEVVTFLRSPEEHTRFITGITSIVSARALANSINSSLAAIPSLNNALELTSGGVGRLAYVSAFKKYPQQKRQSKWRKECTKKFIIEYAQG